MSYRTLARNNPHVYRSSQDSIYREREPETADRGSDGDDANETCAAGAGLMSRNSLKTSDATLDDIREAVNTLEQVAPTARRVLGGTHPTTDGIERALGRSREELRAREETA